MRAYESSHPWITFRLDLKTAPAQLWVQLGEVCSKCEHVAGVPLKPAVADELNTVFLVKGALATTAIEGNTLTESEVRQLVDGKLRLPASREYQAEEVRNVLKALNGIAQAVRDRDVPPISPTLIAEYNRQVLVGLPLEQGVVPGRVREYSVGVQLVNYQGAPAQDCEYLLSRLCEWLNADFNAPPEWRPHRLVFAILKSIMAHLYIAWIHPFGDGNGRTARLVEHHILMSAGVPMPAAHLLSNHYNLTKPEYYRQLARASRSGGNVLPFISYAVAGFVDGLRDQLDRIRQQQWSVAWENYVHESFAGEATQTAERRKHLVLDLSEHGGLVPRNELASLTPWLAKVYAGVTDMTLTRDLNVLLSMGLIEKQAKGWRARREKILAFLSPRMDDESEEGDSAQTSLQLEQAVR